MTTYYSFQAGVLGAPLSEQEVLAPMKLDSLSISFSWGSTSYPEWHGAVNYFMQQCINKLL